MLWNSTNKAGDAFIAFETGCALLTDEVAEVKFKLGRSSDVDSSEEELHTSHVFLQPVCSKSQTTHVSSLQVELTMRSHVSLITGAP